MSFRIESPLLVRLTRDAPYVFFFALFPMFFAYHSLIATGLISPVLPGGGWTFVNAIGVVALAPLAGLAALRSEDLRVHAFVAVLWAWVALYAVYYAVAGTDVQRNPMLFVEVTKLMCGWSCLYAIGYLLRPAANFAKVLMVSLAAMMTIGLSVLDSETLQSPQSGGATYQWFATALVIVAIFSLALAPVNVQPVILAGSLGTLHYLGSRSEFLGFVLVAILWVAAMIWQRRFAIACAGLAASVTIVLLLHPVEAPLDSAQTPSGTLPTTLSKPDSSGQRQMEVLDLNKSPSWKVRRELLDKGWAAIRASPIVGDYGGQLRGPDGGMGTYIHNALSAWRQFGVIPFLLYTGLSIAVVALAVWAVFIRQSIEPMWLLTLYVGAFTLLLIAATKSVFWPLPALAWGLLANLIASPAEECRLAV